MQVAEEHSHSNEHGHEGHECGPDCTGHAHDQHDHSHEHSHGKKAHGHSHGHKHDDAVTSVSITMDGVMDLEKVNYWLGALIELRSEDLYRFKGVLSIADFDRRFVFQVGTPQRAAPLGRAEAVGLLLDKGKPPRQSRPQDPPRRASTCSLKACLTAPGNKVRGASARWFSSARTWTRRSSGKASQSAWYLRHRSLLDCPRLSWTEHTARKRNMLNREGNEAGKNHARGVSEYLIRK